MIFGDGIVDALNALGIGDVGPRVVLAHEFGHHIQFEDGLFDSPLTGPEATRRTELMADAFGTYFAVHAKGLSLNRKRVLNAEQTFFEVGDCSFTNNGHHGTPLQRMRAAAWGASVADAARPQSYILPSRTFAAMFDQKLPESSLRTPPDRRDTTRFAARPCSAWPGDGRPGAGGRRLPRRAGSACSWATTLLMTRPQRRYASRPPSPAWSPGRPPPVRSTSSASTCRSGCPTPAGTGRRPRERTARPAPLLGVHDAGPGGAAGGDARSRERREPRARRGGHLDAGVQPAAEAPEVEALAFAGDVPGVEVHPEASFARLAGRPLPAAEDTAEGQQPARRAPRPPSTSPCRRAFPGAAVDDVLDAAVVAWSAHRVATGDAEPLPDPPEVFGDGWPSAIWV